MSLDDDDYSEQYSSLAPVLLMNWNFEELQNFVDRANANAELPQPPRWLKVTPPNTTPASLTRDILYFLEGYCSQKDKEFGSVALVPRNMEHYSRMISDLAIIEVDPFVQAVMKGSSRVERIAAIGFLQQSSQGFKVGHIRRENKGPFYQIFD